MGKPLVLIDARKDNYLIAINALIAAREDAWLNAKNQRLTRVAKNLPWIVSRTL